MSEPNHQPSPILFFETINAYQRSAALKSGIDLDLFSAIAAGAATATDMAEKCNASERGVRILSDYLVIIGFLTKNNGRYALTADSALFLDRSSPAYLGGAAEFLLTPEIQNTFQDLTTIVRQGTTTLPRDGTVTPDHPVWVKFARAMAPMIGMMANALPGLAEVDANSKLKVLDIAAGHGLFGIAFAQQNPNAEITAVDWPAVLHVAAENAERAGVASRVHKRPGDAVEVELGEGYDIVLLTNFLHHFDPSTCEKLLAKVHAALADGGRAVTLEFVPNADRVTPPAAAAFSLMMLASTPRGDAYTFAEFEKMFSNAGFSGSELHPLPPAVQQVVVSRK
jgi:SAM-dependent methyltransferase